MDNLKIKVSFVKYRVSAISGLLWSRKYSGKRTSAYYLATILLFRALEEATYNWKRFFHKIADYPNVNGP